MSKFTKDAGRFIPAAAAGKLTQEYRVDQLQRKKHIDPVMSEYFGIEKIQELLSQSGATGLRIYYGLDVDGDGKRDKKFVLTATDAEGEDIIPSAERSLEKDAATKNTGILISEIKCPFDCPKVQNPLNADIQ